jgi:hypothetical protein
MRRLSTKIQYVAAYFYHIYYYKTYFLSHFKMAEEKPVNETTDSIHLAQISDTL